MGAMKMATGSIRSPESAAAARNPNSPARTAVRRYLRNPLAVLGAAVFACILILTIGAPLFTHYSPYAANILNTDAPPSPRHILGTDGLGYDNFTRLLYGGRTDLLVAFAAALCVMAIGTVYGGISGYCGGWIDSILMRFVDVMLNFPTILLIIVLQSIMNTQSPWLLIGVVSVTSWPGAARFMRGVFLQLREMDYVVGAQTIGCSRARIIFRHMLPNTAGVLAVLVGFGVSGYIGLIAALQLIGFGLPITDPSWGVMLAPALNYISLTQEPWTWIPPAAMIVSSILCINFISDGLRDALDPTAFR